ncbi:MAG: Rrf2 family transcriptional regulator [Gammaproteobacteria bacterium]|nr:Rrf2 family transcriptional regulator [Gammaproteobacteria bacterium]
MKLSTKGRYAVTAMFDVAIHQIDGPVSLSEISERQGISLSYLEQLFGRMRRRGLVASTRGPGGGYRLAHAADQIAIADIITAVDESVDATRCGGNADCQNQQRCLTHELWEELSSQIHLFLSGITLEDAINKQRVAEVAERQDRMLGSEQRVDFQQV